MSAFAKIASQVHDQLARRMNLAAADRDAEWQRVNSAISDSLKDAFMLFSKLSRLQADFKGEELDRILKISEAVMALGEELAGFSKAFYEGRLEMTDSGFQYGTEPGGEQIPTPSPEAALQLFDKSGEAGESDEEEESSEGEKESYDEEEKPEEQQQ